MLRRLPALAALLLAATLASGAPAPRAADTRPNVVVIMTGDQTAGDLRFMRHTSHLLAGGGVTFRRSYVSYPVCCPSRAYLTGQYAHRGAHRERQESLLAVDEAVQGIVQELAGDGVLDRTCLIFTSDNGFMQAEHRVASGKVLPYDPSTRVPLLLRGPGIPAGRVAGELVGNIDLAPTILEIAGATPTKPLDGRSLLPFARDPGLLSRRPVLHETGGRRFVPGGDVDAGEPPTTRRSFSYRAVRTRRWLWVEYRGGSRELYDLARDPAELRSRHADPRYRRTRAALHRALLRLEHCEGAACRRPIGAVPRPAKRRR